MKTPEQLAAILVPEGGEKRYTVVVEYPDRMQRAVDFRFPVTYVAAVCAKDSREALERGRLQAQQAQENEHRGALADWLVLLVFRGHLDFEEQA